MKKIYTYAGINVPAAKSLAFLIRLEGYFIQILSMLYPRAANKKISITHGNKGAPKTFHMDIQQQKEALLKWIRSCQTAEQIDLLSQRVTEFVVRFSGKIEYYDMELAKEELSDAIIEQRVITAREGKPMRLNTHRVVIQMNRISFSHDEVRLYKPRNQKLYGN